jgi:hypothetical protein
LSGNKDRFGISSPVTFRLKSVECIYWRRSFNRRKIKLNGNDAPAQKRIIRNEQFLFICWWPLMD